MKRKIGRILVVLLLTIILAVSVETARASWPTKLDDKNWNFEKAREWGDFAYVNKDSAELVIGLKEKGDVLSHLITTHGGKIIKTISTRKEILAIVAEIPFDLIPDFARKVKTTGLVEYVEPNLRVRPEFLPNDPNWAYQWGPQKIEADWAWNTTVGAHDVLVAIIDSGIDYNHPDLAANYVGLGFDWANNDTDPMDVYSHGTKVAGIIAATINNGEGIAGLAQVKIMAEKVFNNATGGYISDIASGICHATDQGAQIISMSLSTPDNDPLLYSTVKYAYDAGVLLVAAAGNQANNAKRYPAAYDEVIAVTSTDSDDVPSSFSNFGDWIELAAPGRNIFTTYTTYWNPTYKYEYGSGTSFACPHVSGLAALLWSEFPNETRDWVRARLRETADDLGDPGFDDYYGYGRINARKAIYGNSPIINYTLAITTTVGGTTNPAPGTHTYLEGQNVLVQAIPNIGYGLDHWELDEINVGSANPYSVLMDNNYTLHALFIQINYTLTITTTADGTTSPAPGIYTYAAGSRIQVTAIPNTNHTLDYWKLNGTTAGSTNPYSVLMDNNYTLHAVFRLSVSDIAIANLVPPKTVVGQGYSMDITVTVENQGDYTETFNITIYANTTAITTRTVTLTNGDSATITFIWDTTNVTLGNYVIKAVATTVPGEIDTDDNALINGTVYVGIVGDINADGKVNMRDIGICCMAYGSYPGYPKWNPNADINGDGKIDMRDIGITCTNYGKTDQ